MKKMYHIEVTEVVKKYVWVEAESEEEAIAEGYEEDMEKDIDDIDRRVTVLELTIIGRADGSATTTNGGGFSDERDVRHG